MRKNRDNLLKSADVTGRSWSTEEKHDGTDGSSAEPLAGISLLPFFLCLPSSPVPSHSIRAPPSPREQGECGVFAGSKIYEQLKSRATPCIHQPGHTAASLGGGGMVNHRLYTFISVFSSMRGGYGKMMFCHCGISGYSWNTLSKSEHLSTWKGVKCVLCLHGDVSGLLKSINKIMTKKKQKKKHNHLLFITEGRVT